MWYAKVSEGTCRTVLNHLMGYPTAKRSGLLAVLFGAVLASAASARAAGLPTASFPHDWDLPLPGPERNVQAFTQYASYDVANRAYDPSGNKTALDAVTRSYTLTQRYFRLFQFAALPRIGFGWQVFLSEVSSDTTNNTTGDRTLTRGFGDPTASAGTWIKPSESSAVSYVLFLDMPLGAAGVSRDYWRFKQSVGYDLQLWNLNIDGAIVLILNTDKKTANRSTDVSPGTVVSHALRVGYRLWGFFEPFLGYDVQATAATQVVGSGTTLVGSQYEHGLTAGVDLKIPGGHKASVKYEEGVAGKNTSVTQVLTFRYCYFF